MQSRARWLLVLVPGLMFFYTLGGSPTAAEAASKGGSGGCKRCTPDAGSPDAGSGYDAGTPDAGYDAGTPDAGSGYDAGTPDAGSGGSDGGTVTDCLGDKLLQ